MVVEVGGIGGDDGSGSGCFKWWVVLLSVGDCGGADIVVVVGGGDRLLVLVTMGSSGVRWVFFGGSVLMGSGDCSVVDGVKVVVLMWIVMVGSVIYGGGGGGDSSDRCCFRVNVLLMGVMVTVICCS